MEDSLIQQKSFEFALSIIRLYKKLQARQELVLSTQLLHSGTRIGVSLEEADAEPEAVLNSLSIAFRAARETRYWLKLLQESRLVDVDVSNELKQINELIGLLALAKSDRQPNLLSLADQIDAANTPAGE